MPVTIKKTQRTQSLRSSGGVAVQGGYSSLEKFADGVSQFGGMLAEFQDQIDVADAKSADTAYSDLIREELYGDQTGFMYSEGSDSLNRRATVSERLEAEQKRILEDLSPAARIHAETSMGARYQRALQTVDQHTSGQRKVYMETASNARINTSIQDAIYNPELTAQSIATSFQEIDDQAHANGWPPELVALKKKETSTAIHAGVIDRLEDVSPVQALEYLRKNKSAMNGAEVARIEDVLIPMARQYRGRQAGKAAAFGGGALFDLIDRTEGAGNFDTLFAHSQKSGGRFTNVSVSNMSISEAINFSDPNGEYGRWVKAKLAELGQEPRIATPMGAFQIVGATLRSAVKELGLDLNDKFDKDTQTRIAQHLISKRLSGETTMAGKMSALRKEWEGFKNVKDGELAAAIAGYESGGGVSSISDIQDPDEREAAFAEYNFQMGLKKNAIEQQRAQAKEAAFQLITDGVNVSELPPRFQKQIGLEGMKSLISFQKQKMEGGVRTDLAVYTKLMNLAVENPKEFAQMDMLLLVDKLKETDYKKALDMQNEIKKNGGVDAKFSLAKKQADLSIQTFGLKKTDPVYGRLIRHLSNWQEQNPEISNDEAALFREANQAMSTISVTDKSWFFPSTTDYNAMDIDFNGRTLDANDDVSPEDFIDGLTDGRVKINGTQVPPKLADEVYEDLLNVLGRTPNIEEIKSAIIARVT